MAKQVKSPIRNPNKPTSHKGNATRYFGDNKARVKNLSARTGDAGPKSKKGTM